MNTMHETQKIELFKKKSKENDSFFYENENGRFYKHKLIHTEEIITRKKIDTKDNNAFYAHSIETSYLLTFKDEHGNEFKYNSKIGPKNIGATFYYIIDNYNDDIVDIFPDNDKNKLKEYLSAKKDYKYNNKINRFCDLVEEMPGTILLIGIPVLSFIFFMFNFFYADKDAQFLTCIFFSSLLMFILVACPSLYKTIYEKETDKFIADKQNEEKEAILNTFK